MLRKIKMKKILKGILSAIVTIQMLFSFTVSISGAVENELDHIKKEVALMNAVDQNNSNALPSPALETALERSINSAGKEAEKARESVTQAIGERTSEISKKISEHKDEIIDAADKADDFLSTLQDSLNEKESDIKKKIDTLTLHRDLHKTISEHGGNASDASRLNKLQNKLKAVSREKNKIAKYQKALAHGKKALSAIKTGSKAITAMNSLNEGKHLDAADDVLNLVKECLPDNSGKIRALDSTVKLLSETKAGTSSMDKKLKSEIARISAYSQKLKRAQKLSEHIDKSIKVVGKLKQAKALIDKSLEYYAKYEKLGEDATRSAASRRLIVGMGATGDALKNIAGHLPDGMSDYVEYLGEAMQLPGTVDKVARKWYENRDLAVNITGPLAMTKAGKDYDGVLDRDPLTNHGGTTGVYYDPDRKRFVLITDPEKPAIYIPKSERDKIAQIQSDLSLMGKKLTNKMIEQLRENGYKNIEIDGKPISIDKLNGYASAKKEEALAKAMTAEALGVKNPSAKDIEKYKQFDDLVRFSERVHKYHISDKQRKRLFAKYLDDPKGFMKFLERYGRKHHSDRFTTKPDKIAEEKKAIEKTGREFGLYGEDIGAFVQCMCRNKGGGMLGSHIDEKGACVTCGPLTCWPVAIGTQKSTVLKCVNQIAKARYDRNKKIFKEMHKLDAKTYKKMLVIIENTNRKQVTKEISLIQRSLKEKNNLIEAAKTFLRIKDYLPKSERNKFEVELSTSLDSATHKHIYKGEMNKAVNTSVWHYKVRGNDPEKEVHHQKVLDWKEKWDTATSKTFPEIHEDINTGRIITAEAKIRKASIDMMNGNKLPAAYDSEEYKALKKSIENKKEEFVLVSNKTQKELIAFEKNRDPKSAIVLLKKYLEEWEIDATRKAVLTKKLKHYKFLYDKSIEYANKADAYAQEKNYQEAVKLYKDSLYNQKDLSIQRKLDKLLHTIASAEKLLQEGRKSWKEGNLEQAIAKVAAAGKLMPEDKETARTLQAMQKQKKQIDAIVNKAAEQFKAGKLEQAGKTLDRASTINDKYPKIQKLRKQIADAGKNGEQPANEDHLAEQLRKKAIELWENGALDRAVEQMQKAAQAAPGHSKIARALQGMQRQKKMMDDALSQTDNLIDQKKFKQAREALQQAGRISTKYSPYTAMAGKLADAEKRAEAEKPRTEKVDNLDVVVNGPRVPTTFRFAQEVKLLYLQTYHWNNGQGKTPPGTIGLRHSDGTLYGPWQTRGSSGQGGVPNAYWKVNPNILLKPGVYTVVDSDPKTWATNAQEGWKGFVIIRTGPVDYPDEKSESTPHDDANGGYVSQVPNNISSVQAKYIGCYKEKGHKEKVVPSMKNRVMNGYTFGGNMTVSKCTKVCLGKGFKYAAVQYANQCFCGNSYNMYGVANNCDMPCTGNKNEICGGAWANSVYVLITKASVKDDTTSSVNDPTGQWSTSEGTMILQKDGDNLYGTYDQDQGKISGTMKGVVLNGYWSETQASTRCKKSFQGRFYWGKVMFRFTQESFEGKWGYCDEEPHRNWHGTRITKGQ